MRQEDPLVVAMKAIREFAGFTLSTEGYKDDLEGSTALMDAMILEARAVLARVEGLALEAMDNADLPQYSLGSDNVKPNNTIGFNGMGRVTFFDPLVEERKRRKELFSDTAQAAAWADYVHQVASAMMEGLKVDD